jgi:hypothetical protein
MMFVEETGKWIPRIFQGEKWSTNKVYIVPIDPPKPKYRPFVSAAEFAPYRDRWIRTPGQETVKKVGSYNDKGVDGMSWELLLRNRTFDDGSPCGVEVSK